MWLYLSRSGALLDTQRSRRQWCYAGRHEGKNNPDLQHVKGIGPLPEAVYAIEAPVESPVTGKYTLRLVPHVGSELYGRCSFAIHGDSREHPGEASHGCIVTGFAQRVEIWDSGDHLLKVVAD